MPEQDLSLAALGLLWHLLERHKPTFTMADVQSLEIGGIGKARAARLIAELRIAGYVRRTRGGFVMDGPIAEQWNTNTTPATTPAPMPVAASYTIARCA